MDDASRGAAALNANKYDEAIKHYTDAIAKHPGAVDYFIKRSTAYQRSSKYAEALKDADQAVILAHKRARRELIKDAQLRRAIALFFNEQYANAEHILGIVKKLDEKEKTLPIWSMKVAAKLKDLPEGDERRKVTVKDVPDEASKASSSPESAQAAAPAKAAVIPTPADKIKHDWYQNDQNVTFNLLAKGVPKEKLTVEIDKDSLTISFPIADSSSHFDYTLDPFFAEVDPTQSTYRVTPTKIEVTLKKATPGVKWQSLEGDRQVTSATAETSSIPSHVLSSTASANNPPAYPTSSKSGPKNWDQIAQDDLGDDEDIEGDPTNAFFKKLYKGAGADQQRAMMKSFTESGGTVLSTDWGSVGSKFVDPEPPEGMQANKL